MCAVTAVEPQARDHVDEPGARQPVGERAEQRELAGRLPGRRREYASAQFGREGVDELDEAARHVGLDLVRHAAEQLAYGGQAA